MNNDHNDFIFHEPTVSRPKRKRNTGKKVILVLLYIIVVAALAVSAFFISSYIIAGRNVEETTAPPETTAAPETTADPYAGYAIIQAAQSEIFKGDLILVNSDFPYVFPMLGKVLVNVHQNRPEAIDGYRPYKMSRNDHELTQEALDAFNALMVEFNKATGNHCVQITSAYRSYEKQDELYKSFESSIGAVEAANRAALPGHSEHHIGTALDLNVYGDDKKTYTLDSYDDSYPWLTQNMHKYGYILRYPANKVSITRITYEPWHFRYVGVPHAYIIASNNWCLEEYTAEIRDKHKFGNSLVVEDDMGGKYEIYYVEATGELTDIPVPKDMPYTISGNNVDGFVVTVTLS